MEKIIGTRLEAEVSELENQPGEITVEFGFVEPVINLLKANFKDEDMFYVVGLKNNRVENIMRGGRIDISLFGGVLLSESDYILLIHNVRSTGGSLSNLLEEENKVKQEFLEMAGILEIKVIDYLLLHKFRKIVLN